MDSKMYVVLTWNVFASRLRAVWVKLGDDPHNEIIPLQCHQRARAAAISSIRAAREYAKNEELGNYRVRLTDGSEFGIHNHPDPQDRR